MRYQSVKRPRIESTRMSAGSSKATTERWRAFQRSKPASAFSLVAARAISIRGFVDARRPVGAGDSASAVGDGDRTGLA